MSSNPVTKQNQPIDILHTFAQSQLHGVKRQMVAESAFLELLTSAFFYGSDNLLRKQTQPNSAQNQAVLIEIVSEICGVSPRNTRDLVRALDRFASKYYLIENIVEQGKTAAEQWLNCEEERGNAFAGIVEKYQNLSMFDLGIEGINEKYEKQQKELFSDVSRSVNKLRMRELLLLLLLIATGFAVVMIDKYLI